MVPPEVVAHFPGVALLDPAVRSRLADRCSRKRYAGGELLFRQGDDAIWLAMVEEGRVKRTRHGPSDRDLTIDVVGPWTVLDAAGALDGGRHVFGAVATTDAVVVQVPASDVLATLAASPSALQAVIASLCHDVEALTTRAAELGEPGVERRLAQVVCRLCGRDCPPDAVPVNGPVDVPLSLSRHELAEMVGTSAETAIRVLSRWNRSEVVRTRKDRIEVLSCGRLRAIVRSPPRSLRGL